MEKERNYRKLGSYIRKFKLKTCILLNPYNKNKGLNNGSTISTIIVCQYAEIRTKGSEFDTISIIFCVERIYIYIYIYIYSHYQYMAIF